jgi:glycosyltransferase involved in cell wall biosynthesis
MSLVDVIIPVYNCEKYVLRAIDSVLNQSFKDFSLILVDDGSTDGTKEKICDLPDRDPRISYIRQKNGGAGLARNHGLDVGRSKYVLFMDADDEITPHCINLLTENLEHNPNDFCIGAKVVTQQGSEKRFFPRMFSQNIRSAKVAEIPQIRFHIAPHAKMIRRQFIEKIQLRFPEGVTYEDFVFAYELLLKSSYAGVCSDLCYRYHINEGSISQKGNSPFNIISRWKVEKRLWDLCGELDEDGEIYGDPRAFSMNVRFWNHVNFLGRFKEDVNAFLLWKDLLSANVPLINYAEPGKARVYKNIVSMNFHEFMSFSSKRVSKPAL